MSNRMRTPGEQTQTRMQQDFENWFLSVPGVRHTLLRKDKSNAYEEPEISLLYASYLRGGSDRQKRIIGILKNIKV